VTEPITTEQYYRFVVWSTDAQWFRFLRTRTELEEINFWRPGVKTLTEVKGTRCLFLIRGTNEIWGCGTLSAFNVMPVGLAWDIFGPANGFADLEVFRRKIASLKGVSEGQVGDIGCAVLSSPQYFNDPIDYRGFERMYGPTKPYDVRSLEGARLWTAAVAHFQEAQPILPLIRGGGAKPVLVVPRLGQATFRIELEKQYSTRCAVTGERTRPALEAAHIKPFSIVKEHALQNGLLLRSDIHKLFDQGYVTVTPDRKFRVSRAIRDEFENGRDYYAYEGTPIRETLSSEAKPASEYLDWHSATIFKG